MIPALIAAGSALYQADQNRRSSDNQMDAMRNAQNIVNSVPLPILKEYYPELYKQVVSLVPEAETAQTLGPSAMENVSVDPNLKQAQMNALLKLQQVGDEGGMTATDRARLSQIQDETNTNLRGQQGAITQNLAARGMGGGMSEMVARQLAAQGAANRQGQQGLDVKAQAEQRALQAIMQSGQLGGQMGQQDFNNQAQIAQARDVINKFNTQNTQQVQNANVQNRNQAQATNAQNTQNVANQNVGLSNQAQQYNLNLPQQNYTNQIARATGQAQGLNQQAQLAGQQQQQQNQFLGGVLQTGAQYYAGMNKKKEDEE